MNNSEEILAEVTDLLEIVAAESENMELSIIKRLECCLVKIQYLLEMKMFSNIQYFALREAYSIICHLTTRINRYLAVKNNNMTSPKASSDENNRKATIEQTILKPGETTFNDIAGLEVAKSLLEEAIILPLQYPHLFTGKVKPWRSILMYGPPGTGKSKMAQAVSSEIESTFFSISSSDLLSSWFGESEKMIKQLFDSARSKKCAIIFIDEIDSLCRKRSSKEAEGTRRVKTELLKQMEGASGKSVFLLCATNCPWELDTAFLRRFSKRIYVPLPDGNVRKELFNIHLKGVNVKLSDEELVQLIERTDGYSGSDIANCVSEAILEPIRELKKCTHWIWSEDKSSLRPSSVEQTGTITLRVQNIPKERVEPRQVTIKDLIYSISFNKKTISDDELLRFEEFTQSFGQNA